MDCRGAGLGWRGACSVVPRGPAPGQSSVLLKAASWWLQQRPQRPAEGTESDQLPWEGPSLTERGRRTLRATLRTSGGRPPRLALLAPGRKEKECGQPGRDRPVGDPRQGRQSLVFGVGRCGFSPGSVS